MAVQPIPVNGPAATDANGILAVFVQQPYDTSPSEDSSGVHYSEKWKGPYSSGKEILSKVMTGYTLAQFHSALGANRVSRYDPPACPTRKSLDGTWLVNSIRVNELEAGDHCEIVVDFLADYGTYDVETLTDDPTQDVWSVSWQSYSVNPYAFCSNKPHTDDAWSIYYETGGNPPAPDWSLSASRAHIEMFLNGNGYNVTKGNSTYYIYCPDPSQPDSKYYLNPAEVEIYKKAALGRSATYHYPIVVHQTVSRGKMSSKYNKDIGGDIDVQAAFPTGCPYNFAKAPNKQDWLWLKIGDDMTQTKTDKSTTFQRKETWMGAFQLDQNFYGKGAFQHNESGIVNGRWSIEAI